MGEIKLLHRFGKSHLNVKQIELQRVYLAVQSLSDSMKCKFHQKLFKAALETNIEELMMNIEFKGGHIIYKAGGSAQEHRRHCGRHPHLPEEAWDVAEQSLSALEMLSKKYNSVILHAKDVPSCLRYLDFFSISAQNKSLAITAYCCQGPLLEEYPLVVDALPVLSSRLIHDDKNSVDTSCPALSRLADSYKHDTKKLTEIAREDLTNLQQLLA